MLNFRNLLLMSCDLYRHAILLLRAKLHWNRTVGCWLLEELRAVIVEYTVALIHHQLLIIKEMHFMWSLVPSVPKTRTYICYIKYCFFVHYQYRSSNSHASSPTTNKFIQNRDYRHKWVKMAAVRHVKFLKCSHLVAVIEFQMSCCVANFIEIGWFFVPIWQFDDFQDGGCRPSWILGVQ